MFGAGPFPFGFESPEIATLASYRLLKTINASVMLTSYT